MTNPSDKDILFFNPSVHEVTDEYTQELIIERQGDEKLIENIRGEKLYPGKYTYADTFENVLARTVEKDPSLFLAAWTGSISIKSRVEGMASGLTLAEVVDVIEPRNLDRYYIASSHQAGVRCIDGRCVDHYGERPDTATERLLGAQTAGGTVVSALCDRISGFDDVEESDGYNLVKDVHQFRQRFIDAGFVPGGHIDDHSPENMTGCGAIDKVPEILSKITNPNNQKQVRHLAKMILGENYDSGVIDAILGRLLSLQGAADDYFQKDESGDYGYRNDAIKSIKDSNPDYVPELTGVHKEIGLAINFVRDTTFHTDQFSTDNEGKLQLFGYDFWYTVELAEKLYPVDSEDEITNKQNESLRQRFIATKTVFSIGTCMTLTDGTLELIVRSSGAEDLESTAVAA